MQIYFKFNIASNIKYQPQKSFFTAYSSIVYTYHTSNATLSLSHYCDQIELHEFKFFYIILYIIPICLEIMYIKKAIEGPNLICSNTARVILNVHLFCQYIKLMELNNEFLAMIRHSRDYVRTLMDAKIIGTI